MAFLDIFLFAAVAMFLGYRLWRVLGAYDADKPIRKRHSSEDDTIIAARKLRPIPADRLATSEEKPDPQEEGDAVFLKGATRAFQTIVEAYAAGDAPALRPLLEGPLMDTFEAAIEKRKRAHRTLEVDISRIVKAEIIQRQNEKETAFLTVRFSSEQCLVTRDKKGAIVEGDPDYYTDVIDIWTFARPLRSANPNWKLVATQVA